MDNEWKHAKEKKTNDKNLQKRVADDRSYIMLGSGRVMIFMIDPKGPYGHIIPTLSSAVTYISERGREPALQGGGRGGALTPLQSSGGFESQEEGVESNTRKTPSSPSYLLAWRHCCRAKAVHA